MTVIVTLQSSRTSSVTRPWWARDCWAVGRSRDTQVSPSSHVAWRWDVLILKWINLAFHMLQVSSVRGDETGATTILHCIQGVLLRVCPFLFLHWTTGLISWRPTRERPAPHFSGGHYDWIPFSIMLNDFICSQLEAVGVRDCLVWNFASCIFRFVHIAHFSVITGYISSSNRNVTVGLREFDLINCFTDVYYLFSSGFCFCLDPQQIAVKSGDNVLLQCQDIRSAALELLEWRRPDLDQNVCLEKWEIV